jgi:ribosomal protein L21
MADTDYAIIETGGKQYRAEKGETLLVERLSDAEGAKVSGPAEFHIRPLVLVRRRMREHGEHDLVGVVVLVLPG